MGKKRKQITRSNKNTDQKTNHRRNKLFVQGKRITDGQQKNILENESRTKKQIKIKNLSLIKNKKDQKPIRGLILDYQDKTR